MNRAVRWPVAVVAKTGILGGGRVRTEEGVYRIRQAADGWYSILGRTPASGRVRYNGARDILEIERPGVSLSIQFRSELEKTAFELDRTVYDVATMDFGRISIRERGRSVVEGRVTPSGVRLESVAPDLQPIERELAFGLALRSNEYARGFSQADRAGDGWTMPPPPPIR